MFRRLTLPPKNWYNHKNQYWWWSFTCFARLLSVMVGEFELISKIKLFYILLFFCHCFQSKSLWFLDHMKHSFVYVMKKWISYSSLNNESNFSQKGDVFPGCKISFKDNKSLRLICWMYKLNFKLFHTTGLFLYPLKRVEDSRMF